MAYDSKIKHINNILKPLPEIFSFKEFMTVYDKDILSGADEISSYVLDGLLKQIVRVQLPSGTTIDYNSIIEVPLNIFDKSVNKMHAVVMENLTVYYCKI